MSTLLQYCTFSVADRLLGAPVLDVQEVIGAQPMTRVPLAPGAISGLINLRGQIVTAIDLRRCLGLPERPSNEQPLSVVVRASEGAVSLLVDAIGDVQEVEQEAFETSPPTLQAEARKLIRGAYKLDGRLLLALNTEQVAGGVAEELSN